ncbi:MAG: UDP-N-acetylmuramoyl-L-alanyl-D-glutamate--2,6-diaminopimelate ligase [bacterium]|nr:UDP-N-acetylmuramoyl-L-alanyl-D-glutamate--2,6-diaminopimelate ligase [bacterium]
MSVEAKERNLGRLLSQAGLAPSYSPDDEPGTITGLTDDSRCVVPGGCFVAVRGLRCDGHDYIDAAIAAGARCIVTERPCTLPPDAIDIRVTDSRTAIARLAAAFYELGPGQRHAEMGLVGVTGTNGKSTTCALLRSILTANDYPTALLGTIGYEAGSQSLAAPLTTPAPVDLCRYLSQAADDGATWAVMEVSSHALDQRRCDGLQFSAGVFTNLSGDHLDYHGTEQNYLAAKKRLFDLLDADAVAVVNADDARAEDLLTACQARTVRYGLNGGDLDVTARIESLDATRSRYALMTESGRIPVRSGLIGRHNLQNALAAAATAIALGIDGRVIAAGIAALKSVRGRLEPVAVPGCPFSVFVDYAHTDDALANVLAALRPLTDGRLICVFGCGGDRDRSKRPRMARAVAGRADLAVVTSDNPRSEDPDRIIADALAGFSIDGPCRVEVEADRAAAIQLAIFEARPGDTVLIAGKGHENYQIVGDARLHCDDVETARTHLQARFDPAGVPT